MKLACEGLPRAMPIWISPELNDSGVMTLAGTKPDPGTRGEEDRDMALGLGSGVGSTSPLTPIRYGCRPLLVRTIPIWVVPSRAISSLDSLLSKLVLGPSKPEVVILPVLLESSPAEVLGLAGMTGLVILRGAGTAAATTTGAVLVVVVVEMLLDNFGGGGRGRGRSR